MIYFEGSFSPSNLNFGFLEFGIWDFFHPLNLNLCIFPVAVLGSSLTNSIQRGRLYSAIFFAVFHQQYFSNVRRA